MNLCPLLEDQVRIQAESILLWKRWMFVLILCGVVILILATLRLLPGGNPSGSQVIQLGGLSVSLLSVFPYREMGPRKERLATYRYMLDRFRLFDHLSAEDQTALLSMANDALKETIKR